MQLVFKSHKLDKENKRLISLLRLLGSLQYSIAAMKWYAGEEADRVELPPHESILALSITISSTAEALHTFDSFVRRDIIAVSAKWSERTMQAWSFLNSDKVRHLKQNHLKLIRDKSTFHIDPEPILNYIEQATESNDYIVAWEAESSGEQGHSPLASEIVGLQLLKTTFANEETARLTSQVFGALRDVVLASLEELLEFEVQN
ncbi:hypothetical protein [Brevibacillus porteri]|uniref:hypothetical protein n=1 Tax=Brevibacillus porteri TaxID=2126350 RepID=UPI003D1F4C09